MAVKNVFMDIFYQLLMIQLKVVNCVMNYVKHVNKQQIIALNVNTLC
jgi:hypothetical protein